MPKSLLPSSDDDRLKMGTASAWDCPCCSPVGSKSPVRDVADGEHTHETDARRARLVHQLAVMPFTDYQQCR